MMQACFAFHLSKFCVVTENVLQQRINVNYKSKCHTYELGSFLAIMHLSDKENLSTLWMQIQTLVNLSSVSKLSHWGVSLQTQHKFLVYLVNCPASGPLSILQLEGFLKSIDLDLLKCS